MRLDSPLDADLCRVFGIAALRPPQQAAFDALFGGRDALVVMPTGGGKSLCYQFPAAVGLAPALVVSPLVALMKDQVDALQRRGIAAAQLTSAMSPEQRASTWDRVNGGGIVLLYVAPEALDNPATLRRLSAARTRLLAVDEAHCISEWGESFRPSYLRLREARRALGDPPTIALTATATLRTRRDIIDRLGLRDPELISAGFDRPNLHFAVETVADQLTRRRRLIELVREAPGDVVTYAITRRDTERLAGELRRSGIAARAYHAGLPPDERASVQDDFLAGRLRAIAATCAFGMGVDKPDVRAVIHTTLPLSLEAYYQEAGRAGRDGRPGRCTLLVGAHDADGVRTRLSASPPTLEQLRRIESLLHSPGARQPASPERLARALALPLSTVSVALRMLGEAGALVERRERGGVIRLLASAERLAGDRTVRPDDADFARRLAVHLGAGAWTASAITLAELSALDEGGMPHDRLRRLTDQQVLLWSGVEARLERGIETADQALQRLIDRDAARRGRDAWRFEMVCRFAAPGRCRRLTILRYFGETPRDDRCSACDVCDRVASGDGRGHSSVESVVARTTSRA